MNQNIDKIVSNFTSELIRELYTTVRAEVAAVILSGGSLQPKRGPGRPRKSLYAAPTQYKAKAKARKPKAKPQIKAKVVTKPPSKAEPAPKKATKLAIKAKSPAKRPKAPRKVPNGMPATTPSKQVEMDF